jgi:hypothetical protein
MEWRMKESKWEDLDPYRNIPWVSWKSIEKPWKLKGVHGRQWNSMKTHSLVTAYWRIIGTGANHGFSWADHGNPLCST